MRSGYFAAAAAAAFVVPTFGAPVDAHAAEKCFNKATLTYEDCPKPPAPAPAPAPVVAAPPPTPWTGPYIGAHAGYAWADADVTPEGENLLELNGVGLDDDEFDIEGFLAGGQIGYLHQFRNNLVVGGEIDGSWVWADEEIGAFGLPGANVVGEEDIEGELDYLASARLRLGYALGNVMPYATAGVSLSGWEFSVDDEDEDVTAFGGVAGAGLEALLAERFVVGVEGLYYFFDEAEDFGTDEDIVDINNVLVGRVRASYKF